MQIEQFNIHDLILSSINEKSVNVQELPCKYMDINNIITLETNDDILCSDLIDGVDRSYLMVCTKDVIRLYSITDKPFLHFRFKIIYDIDNTLNYDAVSHWPLEARVFLEKCRSVANPQEQLYVCKFGTEHMYAAGELAVIYMISINRNPQYKYLYGHHSIITCIDTDNNYMFSSGTDGQIIQWKSGQLLNRYCQLAECLCVSSDNQHNIASAHSDEFIRIWNICHTQSNPVVKFKVRAPYSDAYPQIQQIKLFNQIIISHHINGIVDYFMFDDNNAQTIYSMDIEDNYFQRVAIHYPYVAFHQVDSIVIHDLEHYYVAVQLQSEFKHFCLSAKMLIGHKGNQFFIRSL